MKKYIAYYRVSTKEQGDSGLGLLSQQQSVKRFVGENGELSYEYQEIESGKKSDRPQLIRAIKKAKEIGATLIIAKLDRLSRNAKFIFTLKESGVDFICADMPQANSLTIGILAVLAEDEVRRLSERTSSALSQIKRKLENGEEHISKTGRVVKRLGSPQNLTASSIDKGREVRQQNAYDNPESKKAGAFIISLASKGESFKKITDELNNAGFKTPRGYDFNPAQTKRLYERYS